MFTAASKRGITEDIREPYDGSGTCRRHRKSKHPLVEAITCDDITTTAQANTDSHSTVDTETVSCGKESNYCCVGWNMDAVGLPVITPAGGGHGLHPEVKKIDGYSM